MVQRSTFGFYDFCDFGNICFWLSNVHGKHEAPNVVVSAWQKRKRGAEKLEKKCPTNPFSTASSEAKCGWLKRDQAHTASAPVVLLIITEEGLLARVQKKPCVVQYHHSLVLFRYLSFDPFKLLFLLSFLGSRRAIAAQIVNALVGQKKADLAHIKRIQRHQLQLRIELKPEKIRSLGINE